MSRAAAFLDRFRRAAQDDALLALFADDHEGWGDAMAQAPAALLAAASAAADARSTPADLHADSFASAACDRDGNIIIADPRFAVWLDGVDPLAAVVRRLTPERPSVSAIADDRTGRPVALAAAAPALAAHWPIAPAVRAALAAGAARYAVIAFRPGTLAWERAAQIYALTPSQTRLVAALARRGNLRAAATDAGTTYETARKQIALVMDKVGAQRQTDLVRKLLAAAGGDWRPPENAARLFSDLFALTPGQAQLAREIASGATRDAAAAAQGKSGHSGKADLKLIFAACGVANAVDLARIVAEVDALAGLVTACSVEVMHNGAQGEPLRLLARRAGSGRIAVADYGPAAASPVIVFHNSVAGRHQPQALIMALQARGFRPILFERAGFGLSDAVDGNPYAAAVSDFGDILDALGLARVRLLVRGGSTAALHCAAAYPGNVNGGVLLGPDPPADLDRRHIGMMGRAKALFFGTPMLAGAFARLMSRRTNSAMIARLYRESVAGSPVDMAALEDPQVIADLVRAGRQSALGMQGFLAEMLAHGGGARPPALADAAGWVVLTGEQDPLYAFADAAAFWRETLPGARFETVADGGRFLHITHTVAVAAALGNP
jgi:pimeloyl-ACP methyl ester carboxylesterase/DNA-binding CsgD family transcriptional regulator